jgi:hypothetical protein
MDFLLENIYLLIFVAAGIAQWVNSRREAKKAEMEEARHRREHPQPLEEEEDVFGPDFDFGELQENLERELERRAPAPATPPPLPTATTTTSGGPLPGVERTPAPALRRNPPPQPQMETTQAPSKFEAELARQASMLEQVRIFKQAKTAKTLEDAAALKARAAYGGAAVARAAGGTSLRARLRNGRELKQAFVLKEVLEKPVGLRN